MSAHPLRPLQPLWTSRPPLASRGHLFCPRPDARSPRVRLPDARARHRSCGHRAGGRRESLVKASSCSLWRGPDTPGQESLPSSKLLTFPVALGPTEPRRTGPLRSEPVRGAGALPGGGLTQTTALGRPSCAAHPRLMERAGVPKPRPRTPPPTPAGRAPLGAGCSAPSL